MKIRKTVGIDLGTTNSPAAVEQELEIHITSPQNVQETAYRLAGVVKLCAQSTIDNRQSTIDLQGSSVRVQCAVLGLIEEVFLDEGGCFEQAISLQRDAIQVLELTLCDPAGHDLLRFPVSVRHAARQPGVVNAASAAPPLVAVPILEPPW